jgi:hypothetical protein
LEKCATLVAFEPLQLGEDVNQRSALFRSTIPLGSTPCARKNRLNYGSSANELELRFGRGPRLPKYIPGFGLRQYSGQHRNLPAWGFVSVYRN